MLSSCRLVVAIAALVSFVDAAFATDPPSPKSIQKSLTLRTEGLVPFLSFSPNSATIAYGLSPIGLSPRCVPATVLLNSTTGKEISRFLDTPGGYPGVGVFSPDGNVLAVGSTSTGISLWDVGKKTTVGPVDEGLWDGRPLA